MVAVAAGADRPAKPSASAPAPPAVSWRRVSVSDRLFHCSVIVFLRRRSFRFICSVPARGAQDLPCARLFVRFLGPVVGPLLDPTNATALFDSRETPC